ncbi:serine/threonine-protein kinase [Okeania sp.]|uniref:serine/threonine-protein kinase n=1 Tax=Okeania sp. TaxID=3100323 RepID=UPI002B4B3A6D|nr:serine/threonine-protein kinase [Okeania sp.]MEB3340783.1 serine/threonine-protein kinase [Okeania sp.]
MINRILRNRYQIKSQLGQGNFGTTYLAIDLSHSHHPQCVVKQLTPLDQRPEVFQLAKRLFEKEAKALKNLGKHNQIPTFFDYFEEAGQFYLIQEFVAENNLTKEIDPNKKFTENETIKLLIGILEVLKYVHQQNVIHRDLKLENIMRRKSDGKIVLIDFGAVKEIKGLTVTSGGHTMTTMVIGTPGYMPSEQAAGKPKFCSDIYAVGMIAIEALTGMRVNKFPENPSTGEIIWKNQVDVSKDLALILDKMVLYDWRSRYQNVDEVITELKNIGKTPVSMKRLGIFSGIIAFGVLAFVILTSIFSKGVMEAGVGKDVEAMYKHLDDFAAAGKWRKADQQNWQLINQVGDRDGNYSYISKEEANNFSCSDLQRINQIWRERSNGKFGYTSQLEVIQENGDTLKAVRDEDVRALRRFAIAVGWKTGTDEDGNGYLLQEENLKFTIDAPKGHLPNGHPTSNYENKIFILTKVAGCKL